jgi:pSer/pThr/pTyr-binding forkhead associated (FHA) protein
MPKTPLAPHMASAPELKERLDAERAGIPFLVYRDRDDKQRIYALEDAASRKITIGRGLANDIALHWDSGVSRVHTELERVSGHWTVVDDGLSRNGTFVNGERIGGRRRLRDGDTVRVGDTVLAYRTTSPSESGTTVAAGTLPPAATLSEAQRRVLTALCRPFKDSGGYVTPATNQQIADELYLSIDAVKTHLRTLFQKFGVGELPQNQKRARLVELAFQSGIISQRDL